MTNKQNLYLTTDESCEYAVDNLFDELLIVKMYKAYNGGNYELSPYAGIMLDDEVGNKRNIILTFDQLSALIKQLQDLQIAMLKHLADISTPIDNKEVEKKPFKGNNALEMVDNLFKNFSYKPVKPHHYDSRRKRNNK